MPGKYSARIEAYCAENGITIPAGIYRRSASNYAVVFLDEPTPKLVARTWFSQADVINYLETYASGRDYKVLDFKEGKELTFDGGKRLRHRALL